MTTPRLAEKITGQITSWGFRLANTNTPKHSVGLPSGGDWVLVDTEWCPVDGFHLVMVGPSTLQAYTLTCPTVHAQWRPFSGERSYETLPELQKNLREMTRQVVAECWK